MPIGPIGDRGSNGKPGLQGKKGLQGVKLGCIKSSCFILFWLITTYNYQFGGLRFNYFDYEVINNMKISIKFSLIYQ